MKNCYTFIGKMLLVMGVLTGSLAYAQNTNSSDVRGIVTDPSGAVLPGVVVTIRNVQKGTVHTVLTNAAGLYDTGPIIPDQYTLRFSHQGFETLLRGPLTLEVSQYTVNAQLKIGEQKQVVVVTDQIPLLNTETGSQAETLKAHTLEKLPEVGADWENFIGLLPGVAGNYSAPQADSINGNPPFNSILLDGGNATLPMSQNTDVAVLETIAEFKVQDSAFSAENGIGGAIFNQITKGGSNQWHGVLYEYFQNNAMNAADYAFGRKSSAAVLRYNNFGGSFSGPILKNRMFFYFNYDGTRQYGGSSNGFTTMPTAAMWHGDFTGMPTIYDPTTQTIDSNGQVHRLSFEQEYHNGNRIPSFMISSVAKAIGAYYPAPNAPGTTTASGLPLNNYFYNIPNTNPFDKFFGRLDYNITSKNRLTISEIEQNNSKINRWIDCAITCQKGSVNPNFAQITDVWTISPKMINEARFGYAQELDFYAPVPLNQGYPGKLGWQFAKADNFPAIGIRNMWGIGPASNSMYKEFSFDPSDVFTLILGRHVLHFGGEILASRADSTSWGNINAGSMGFNGDYTAATQGATNTSGIGLADFLLGYASNWSAAVSPEYGGRLKIPQAFVQDDFKATQNLTLNMGVRWQGMVGWNEVHGNIQTWDPTLMNPVTHTLGAMWNGVTKLNGRSSLQKSIWDTFMPRLGFSYMLDPTTVVRGGVGLYAYTWSMDTYGQGMGSLFAKSGNVSDATNGALPVVLLDSNGTENYQGSAGQSIQSAYQGYDTSPNAYSGQNVGFNLYHTPLGKIWQYTLSIQKQLGQTVGTQIAYVGSHGFDDPFATDLNQVPENKLAPNDASGTTNARPYPNYQSIGGRTYGTYSWYNSLQLSITKRMTQGLQLNANYVWSHFLDNQDSAGCCGSAGPIYWQNAYNQKAEYGASNFDHRNVFKAYAVYSLPFGHGREFLNHNPIADVVLGGWHTALTVIAQSGGPFTLVMANNTSYSQAGSLYPNMVGDPRLRNRSIHDWYNLAAFAAPKPGTFGDNHRNNVYGPGMSEVNFSLGKTFTITNRMKFELRGDAVNVLNHPSFANPDNVIGPGHDGSITGVSVGGRHLELYGRFSF